MALEKIGLEAVIEGMSQFARDAANLNQSYLDFAKNSRIMQEANQDASGALRTFGIDVSALNSPLSLIAGTVKDSIDLTVRWADEIDQLSRTTGVEAREASKLAIIFGDFNISTGQLNLAIKTLSKQGIELNIDSLKKLAAQYQALPTTVEKNEFALKMFGRTGLSMTEILSKTTTQLDDLSAAADRSGKVMGTDGVERAQALKLQLAQLNDQADGLKVTLGSILIPTVSKAAGAFDDLTRILELNRLKNLELTHQISNAEYQMRAAQVAGMDLNKVAENLSGGYDIENARVQALNMSTQTITATTGAYDYMIQQASDSTKEYTSYLSGQKEMADAVAAGVAGTLTNAQQNYTNTVAKNKDEIEKLQGELKKLEAQQGLVVDVTNKQTVSDDQFSLAQDKAALLTEKLVLAQQKLAENTDPKKTLALQLAVDQLSVSLDAQNNTINKYTEEQGVSSTVTIDNSKKIEELTGKLNDLTGQNDAAEAAMKRATDMMLYQKLSAGESADVQLKLALQLGVLSKADYDAATAALALKAEYDSGKISSDAYAASAANLAAKIADLHDKTITVTTTFITVGGEPEYGGAPGQGGRRQHGGDMFAGGTYTVGEAGPETVVMSYGHATVIPSVSNTTNFNYSPTYGGAPASPSHDFSVMQALV